jgi:hypothetical protein
MRASLLVAAYLSSACATAAGDIKVFIGGEHFFHEPTAWSPPGVPTPQDRIVIPAGQQEDVPAVVESPDGGSGC